MTNRPNLSEEEKEHYNKVAMDKIYENKIVDALETIANAAGHGECYAIIDALEYGNAIDPELNEKWYRLFSERDNTKFKTPRTDKAWSKVVELNDRVKMLEDIIAKHTSIPKAVIPMLTTKFPEIVQSEITHFDPNSTEVKELIEKCKPYLDYNTNNEILTLHQNNIE